MQLFKKRYVGKRVLKNSHKDIPKAAAFPITAAVVCVLSAFTLSHVSATENDAKDQLGVNVTPPVVMSAQSRSNRSIVTSQLSMTVQEAMNQMVAPTPTTPTPTPIQTPTPTQWFVTADPSSDVRGNACTIYNFVAYQWDEARTWLQENYTEGWPFGRVKDERPAVELGPTIGMAIVANAMRESSCIPNNQQGRGPLSASVSNQEAINTLMSLGTKSGRAWGIIQWDGGRRENFLRFCNASGFDPRSLEIQLYYLAYEYYASTEFSNYSSLVSRYSSTAPTLSDVKEAAEVFRKKVERGGTQYSANGILENWGNKWNSAWGPKPSGGLFTYLSDYASTGVVQR